MGVTPVPQGKGVKERAERPSERTAIGQHRTGEQDASSYPGHGHSPHSDSDSLTSTVASQPGRRGYLYQHAGLRADVTQTRATHTARSPPQADRRRARTHRPGEHLLAAAYRQHTVSLASRTGSECTAAQIRLTNFAKIFPKKGNFDHPQCHFHKKSI